MMPSLNKIIIAAAGSRKTTFLVEKAIENPNKKILITTFTIENYNQIRRLFYTKVHHIPPNVSIVPWYTFLLRDCARPYQSYLYKKRISTICMVEGRSPQGIKESDTKRFYFADSDRIYTDKIGQFACTCNELSQGLVVKRLELLYDEIFIDEVQDLAGYDLDVVELLLRSNIVLTLVGDSRQVTFVTNYSPKNSRFKGRRISYLFSAWEKANLCEIETRSECYRCNQPICDFADALYPNFSKTISKNEETTGHDGLFIVKSKDVDEYIEAHKPQVLQYQRNIKTERFKPINFGISKGLTFDRVLIFCTKPMSTYLETGQLSGDISKFYVGVTRARYSVAFVYDKPTNAFNINQT